MLFDWGNVIDGGCEPNQAALAAGGPMLMTAPMRMSDSFTKESMKELADKLAKDYDYIFFDAPAGLSDGFELACAAADRGIVVSLSLIHIFVMTRDSAFGTLLYDVRKGREGWSSEMLKMFNVKPEHMADIIDSTALVGGLTERAAGELGLCEGTPVFGGGGDASLIGVGAGAVALGDTHIYRCV